jgi:phosphoglycerate kinase
MADSLVEPDRLDEARELLESAAGRNVLLPVDLVVADAFEASAERRVVAAQDGVPAGWRALDVGPQTVSAFARRLHGAGTVVWNGPMGVFEMEPFAAGTFGLAEAVGRERDAVTIVGGGDSVAALNQAGLADRVDWVSTGGGAMLDFMAGVALPAVVALAEAAQRSGTRSAS